jgi:hypothetical protein
MSARQPTVTPSPRTRSAITNRSRIHQNGDARSAGARRFRDLIAAFSADLGDNLSEADIAMIRTAAALTLKSEQMQAALIAGQTIDSDVLIRLASTSRRSLQAISAKAVNRKPGAASLQDYLDRRVAPDDGEEV